MRLSATCQRTIASDTGILVLSALFVVALHTATNGQYGFHRDEPAQLVAACAAVVAGPPVSFG
jgi:hypothetical protein